MDDMVGIRSTEIRQPLGALFWIGSVRCVPRLHLFTVQYGEEEEVSTAGMKSGLCLLFKTIY